MSMIALQKPDFSRKSIYGRRVYHNYLQRVSSSRTMAASSKHTPAWKEKELSRELQKLFIPKIGKFGLSNIIKFDRLQQSDQVAIQGDTAKFGQFVAREAQLDEEYWTAAWLRAESHWESRDTDRYVDNYRRKFAQQEFNAMKKRYNSQLGETCKCILMFQQKPYKVKKEDSVLKSVVGTLDLSIRHLSHGETFPGEQVKPPPFCLINGTASSRYGYVANLCVAKSARRQGIASNMLHFAILLAKELGAERVFVHVYRENKAAQVLYQKMGFEIVDAATSQLSADQTYLLCLEASKYLGQSVPITTHKLLDYEI